MVGLPREGDEPRFMSCPRELGNTAKTKTFKLCSSLDEQVYHIQRFSHWRLSHVEKLWANYGTQPCWYCRNKVIIDIRVIDIAESSPLQPNFRLWKERFQLTRHFQWVLSNYKLYWIKNITIVWSYVLDYNWKSGWKSYVHCAPIVVSL